MTTARYVTEVIDGVLHLWRVGDAGSDGMYLIDENAKVSPIYLDDGREGVHIEETSGQVWLLVPEEQGVLA